MPTTCLVICTEPGRLEQQSLLLVESLRTFGGCFKDVDIISFSPRKHLKPSACTLQKLKKLNVEINCNDINADFTFNPTLNKLVSCAFVEQTSNYDQVVMLDSDQIFFNEPSLWNLRGEDDIALRPVHVRNIGLKSSESPRGLWINVYDLLGVKNMYYTRTSVTGEEIYSYWNAGMIVSASYRNLFGKSLENLVKIREKVSFSGREAYFIDQVAISATILQQGLCVNELPREYNYPFKPNIVNGNKIGKIENLVSLHYHKRFEKYLLQNPLSIDFENSDKLTWALGKSVEYGLFPPDIKTYARHKLRDMRRYLTK